MAFGSETEDCGLLPVAKEQENISGASTSSGRRKLQSIVKSTLQSEEPEAKQSKPHVCTYPGCKAAFSRPWRLEAHHSVHCGEAPFACNKAGCTKKYTSQSHLTRHQKSAHSGGLTPSKLIPCPFEGCKGKFKTNQNVKKHVKRSHVEKVCPICSYRYYRKLELKYHMQIHTGVYLFKCDDCDLTFFRKTEYNRHMRGHKFFMCTRLDCDEAFDKWSLMRKHLVSHKPLYICYYCGKPSNKKNSFTSHVLTHLPDHPTRFNALKRYDCYHCKASVSGKQSLRRHMQVIHLNPRSKVVKKPKKPRAPRKDRGKPKPFVVPESTRLAGVSCAVPLAKALVSAEEPLLETIEDIVEVIEEALIDLEIVEEGSLLVMVLDLNPSQRAMSANPKGFNHTLEAIIAFANAHLMLRQNNKLAILACHAKSSEYIYSDKDNNIVPTGQNDAQYELFAHVERVVRTGLKRFIRQIEPSTGDSLLAGSCSMAMCYIQRAQREKPVGTTMNSRILIITGSGDSASQYMNYMNVFFTAQKEGVQIDVLSMEQDLGLLQQGCDITGGVYLKIPQQNGLLQYLLWVFLADPPVRKKLLLPPPVKVDYRAACFCHRQLIDIGYVCSVCLSVFCKFSPICTTCHALFKTPGPLPSKAKKKKLK